MEGNLIECDKGKYRDLQQYRLGVDLLEWRTVEKDMRVLVDKFPMRQQGAFMAKKEMVPWGRLKRVWPAGHGSFSLL